MNQPRSRDGMSLIVRTICRWLKGFILLYGIHIILYGHLTPGGGFAGGIDAGRGASNAGFGQSYWNDGPETPETRDALLRGEIDLLSSRLEALKRELDASTQASPSEDE